MHAASNVLTAMIGHPESHRFSLETYEVMIERGILTESDRVELIRGEVVDVSPIGTAHAACVAQMTRSFVLTLGERAIVSVQSPVAMPPSSMPEPDLTVLRARDDFYASRRPLPDDIVLIVEVADSSLSFDRLIKGALYAEAGLPEYWIANLSGECIEVYRRPAEGAYSEMRTYRRGDAIACGAFADLDVAVDRLLPVLG